MHREGFPQVYAEISRLGKAEVCRRYLPAWAYHEPHSITEEQIAALLVDHNLALDEHKWPKTKRQMAPGAHPISEQGSGNAPAGEPIQANAGDMGVQPVEAANRLGTVPDDAAQDNEGEIQWMPGGRTKVTAQKGGKPITLEVEATAETARLLNAELQDRLQAAARGEGPEPFFDFGHKHDEASAHPLEFSWGGDDPVKGGIRAKVRWTEAGQAKVRGRAYRKFSPSFRPPVPGTVLVTSAPYNMGGLVNFPAFDRIATVTAQEGDPASVSSADPMDKLPEALQTAGLVTAAAATPDQVTAQINAKMKEKDDEIARLKEVSAKAIVEKAIQAGRLPAGDVNAHGEWEKRITADPTVGTLLESLPASHKVPTAVTAGKQGGAVKAGVLSDSDAIMAKAREVAVSQGISVGKALENLIDAGAVDYDTYREGIIEASVAAE